MKGKILQAFALLMVGVLVMGQKNIVPQREQVTFAVATAQVAAITTTNLIASVPVSSQYRIDVALTCTTTSAAATAQVTIGWTDTSTTAQTVTLASAAVCTALGASSYGSLGITINAKVGTAITYAVSIVNTPTYDIRVAATQLTGS